MTWTPSNLINTMINTSASIAALICAAMHFVRARMLCEGRAPATCSTDKASKTGSNEHTQKLFMSQMLTGWTKFCEMTYRCH